VPDRPMAPADRRIRVLLADDHVVVREGLKTLINQEPDMLVVGEAVDGRDLLRLAEKVRPDVIIMDVSMPHVNGIDATREIKEALPAIKILALSAHEDRVYIRRMVEAGATGFVLKRAMAGELLRAVRLIAAGALYLDPETAHRLDSLLSSSSSSSSARNVRGDLPSLTPRETEVLRLIALGFSNKEIGSQLGIAVKTVETHRARSMEKLDLQSRAGIVRLAIEQGWLQAAD